MPPRKHHPPVWDLKAGDTGTHSLCYIEGLDDTSTLAAVTGVSGRVWPAGKPAEAVALTGAVVDSAARTVKLTHGSWLAGLTAPATDDDPDEYHAVVILATGDEDPYTWPERGYLLWRVWTPGVLAV